MGLFDRWRAAPEAPWSPPALGSCSCENHVENMLEVRIPLAAHAPEGDPDGAISAAELLECDALAVRLAGVSETFLELPPTGQRTGPYHWVLSLGDEARLLYDDDAPVQLDDCLAVQPGIERVAWTDRELFAVGAPELCPAGVQAALVSALTNPRVRRQQEPMETGG